MKPLPARRHSSYPASPSDGNLELSSFPASRTPFIVKETTPYILDIDIEKQPRYLITSIFPLTSEPDIDTDSWCSIRFILLTILTIIYYAACMTAVTWGTDGEPATDGAGNRELAGGAGQGKQKYRAFATVGGIIMAITPVVVGGLMLAMGRERQCDREELEIVIL